MDFSGFNWSLHEKADLSKVYDKSEAERTILRGKEA
jgi:hypothetical protein